MVNGFWQLNIRGEGKVHPADADEIQELVVAFKQVLTAAGHTVDSLDIRKKV